MNSLAARSSEVAGEKAELAEQTDSTTKCQLPPIRYADLTQTMLAIGDDTAAKVMVVVSKRDLDTERKLDAISELDERYWSWNSPKLGELLNLTSTRIRQTEWWRVKRNAWMEDHTDYD